MSLVNAFSLVSSLVIGLGKLNSTKYRVSAGGPASLDAGCDPQVRHSGEALHYVWILRLHAQILTDLGVANLASKDTNMRVTMCVQIYVSQHHNRPHHLYRSAAPIPARLHLMRYSHCCKSCDGSACAEIRAAFCRNRPLDRARLRSCSHMN